MTHIETVETPATRPAIGEPEPAIVYVDPEIAALIAEADAILCAALARLRRLPPAPPVTGCALVQPQSTGRSCEAPARPRRGPVHPVRAVQRGPPRREPPATKLRQPEVKGR